MKTRLISIFPALLTVILSTLACTHVGTTEDPQAEPAPVSAEEATVTDSDSDPQTLPKDDAATATNEEDDLTREREEAKEAKPLVENVSIIFEGKQTKLPKSSDALLKEVANQMKLDSSLKVRLDAYSVKGGKANQKQKLAAETLKNVKSKLQKYGVDSKRIRVTTYSKGMIDADRKVDVVYE